MKKIFLTLLVLLICTIQTTTAYEYFTIYFSDGTKSEIFYATDVDSICYSRYGLNGYLYKDWQVQKIYTCDSVYSYALSDIDSLSFKDVDEKNVAKDIAYVSRIIMPFFSECNSQTKLSEHLPEIRNIDGVEDAYLSKQNLFVKIRDWGFISFVYPIDDSDIDDGADLKFLSRKNEYNSRENNKTNIHQHTNVLNACVVNQQYNDEKRSNFQTIAEQFCISFESMGIKPHIENNPLLDFFRNGIFDYDILFLKTHGDYDSIHNIHWLCTGEELMSYNPQKNNVGYIDSLLFIKIPIWFKHGYSPRKVGFMCIKEKRDGEIVNIFYSSISDEFIGSAKRKFKNAGSAIVFNTACESMKSNKMAEAFEKRGAGCYLGYDDSNSIGGIAGKYLFAYLLTGKSIQGAVDAIPEWCKEQIIYENENGEIYDVLPSGKKTIKYNPKLIVHPQNSVLCITHPETKFAEEVSDGERISIKLIGGMKCANISGATGNVFGFQLSKNFDMSQADTIKAEGYYDNNTLYMNWGKTLDNNDLKPNTTYYYRAYMNDGYSNCYGEIKLFTTKNDGSGIARSDMIPYCILNDGTLTFYYDDKYYNRVGEMKRITVLNARDESFGPSIFFVGSSPNEQRMRDSVKKVVFDSSFANYVPNALWGMFYGWRNLEIVENLRYLNTSNVTDLKYMFWNCKSLAHIDLNGFNTANIKYMYQMFKGCSSLTSLDLSSFNTSNVIFMYSMFEGCSSLTSLDLSSFNTSKVTDMQSMFEGCSSLTSLDLSSFNTSNVTCMRNMFWGCSSLTILDLSSFNTPKRTDIDSMFLVCSSLKTIYAGNWNAYGTYTFKGCESLVGGKGTKIGDNLYGYDKDGTPLYYYCSYFGSSAHIDGGKDDPGLFTAK